MLQKSETVTFVSEEVAEVRFRPSGTFLDVHGKVADFIESKGLFPSWAITDQIVNFKDTEDGPKHFSAFVSYRNAGFVCFDPPTRNQFVDKATQYWTTLASQNEFQIRGIQRIGVRNKCFVKSTDTFESLEKRMFTHLFSGGADAVVQGTRKDFSAIFEIHVGEFDIRLTIAPLHEKEAPKHFQFKSDHFDAAGMLIDVDIYATRVFETRDVVSFMRSASKETWARVEKIAEVLGA